MLLEAAMFVVVMTAVSLFVQDKFNVPSPITLLSSVIVFKLFSIEVMNIDTHAFDQIVILLLPVIISVDALALRMSDIKRHGLSLFYVAFLMVFLSIVAAVSLNKFILPDYHLTIPALTALFCMIMATDPVSVSSVFGKVNLPHNLKIIAEGESLFNDASALIVFGIALNFMKAGMEYSVVDIGVYGVSVIVGAIFMGMVVGFLGLAVLKLTRNPKVETAIVLAIAFLSYMGAEHFHWSGILAVIVAMLTANFVITNRIIEDEAIIKKTIKSKFLNKFNDAIQDKANQEMVYSNIQYISVLGTTVLFLSVGVLVNLELLLTYWKEILSVFIATTLIRMLMLAKFSVLSNNIKAMHNISVHWWMVLSAAGVKGAISILMLHMMPSDFAHKELFEAIVVGNIMLTTFIYPVILMGVIRIYKKTFEKEYEDEKLHSH